jgi:hypothetical protein
VALDATGRPVTDLTADDFEVVHGGRTQKIANFTWFDTRLHARFAAASGATSAWIWCLMRSVATWCDRR